MQALCMCNVFIHVNHVVWMLRTQYFTRFLSSNKACLWNDCFWGGTTELGIRNHKSTESVLSLLEKTAVCDGETIHNYRWCPTNEIEIKKQFLVLLV